MLPSKLNLHKTYLEKDSLGIVHGRKPNISYFHPFGCKCFILNTKDNLRKFDSKSDNGIFYWILRNFKGVESVQLKKLSC